MQTIIEFPSAFHKQFWRLSAMRDIGGVARQPGILVPAVEYLAWPHMKGCARDVRESMASRVNIAFPSALHGDNKA